MSLRTVELASEFSNPVEAVKQTILSAPSASLARHGTSPFLFVTLQQKTRIGLSIRVFKLLPRWCRSGDSPVPFRKGWMTVAAEFGFQ
jgi:hypothetical protein